MLRYVTRHGRCTGEQLAARFFGGSSAVWRRLRVLESLGLIHRYRTWWKGPRVVVATPLGTQLGGADLSPAAMALADLEHALAVVDLSEQLLAEHPGSQWLTERELRRNNVQAHRQTGMDARPVRVRIPDGVLLLGEQRIAVELELTAKRPDVYDAIFRAYAAAQGVDAVWWFAPRPALQRRLADLAATYRLSEFMTVHPWNGGLDGAEIGG